MTQYTCTCTCACYVLCRLSCNPFFKVLSESVANVLAFYGDPATKETERFVRTFDKFFDCLNVRCCGEYCKRRKPNLAPYRQESDERLVVSLMIVGYMVLLNHTRV